MERITGTVHWFAESGQSYGFINYMSEGTKTQVYVHYKQIGTSNLRPEDYKNNKWFRRLYKGDVVEFEVAPPFGQDKGSQAVRVEIIKHGYSH